MAKNQPAHKVKIGLITATIWENDGFYSVELSRAYKNADDNWVSTTGFTHGDLLNVAMCAKRAEAWIAEQNGKPPS